MASGYWLVANVANNITSAQNTPELLITWQAQGYVPHGYQGKILPVKKSLVEAAAELIQNGKTADLSRRELRWFLNGRLIQGGLGLKTISFMVPEDAASLSLRLVIPNYGGRVLEKTVALPLAQPEVVIDAPYAAAIASGTNIFRALAYFFNISGLDQLTFEWVANGVATAGEDSNPAELELNISGGRPGDEVNLSVNALNKFDPLETAGASVNLKIR